MFPLPAFSQVIPLCQLCLCGANGGAVWLMPEALVCCHLRDHLGLLVSTTSIHSTFLRHFANPANHSTPSLLDSIRFRDFKRECCCPPVPQDMDTKWVLPEFWRTRYLITRLLSRSQIFWILLYFRVSWSAYTTCSRPCVDYSSSLSVSFGSKRFFLGRSSWLSVRTQTLCTT